MYAILIYQERDLNLAIKILVYWKTASSVKGTHILKTKSIIISIRYKYLLEISLIKIGYSKYYILGLTTLICQKLLKFIFNKIKFHKI